MVPICLLEIYSILFGRLFSQFGRIISLFGFQNPLFCCVGNFLEKSHISGSSPPVANPHEAWFRKNSLFFPC
jgi:hypothetical protein